MILLLGDFVNNNGNVIDEKLASDKNQLVRTGTGSKEDFAMSAFASLSTSHDRKTQKKQYAWR